MGDDPSWQRKARVLAEQTALAWNDAELLLREVGDDLDLAKQVARLAASSGQNAIAIARSITIKGRRSPDGSLGGIMMAVREVADELGMGAVDISSGSAGEVTATFSRRERDEIVEQFRQASALWLPAGVVLEIVMPTGPKLDAEAELEKLGEMLDLLEVQCG